MWLLLLVLPLVLLIASVLFVVCVPGVGVAVVNVGVTTALVDSVVDSVVSCRVRVAEFVGVSGVADVICVGCVVDIVVASDGVVIESVVIVVYVVVSSVMVLFALLVSCVGCVVAVPVVWRNVADVGGWCCWH